jgi:predicted nucleic acid-binding protein
MLVVDTSAVISLELADVLDTVLSEYAVRTTDPVLSELSETAAYDGVHGVTAETALDRLGDVPVHDISATELQTSRVDAGEASCARLATDQEAAFLITDDLRALPELQQLTGAQVAISPILLRALVNRGCLAQADASERLERLAADRDWLGAPIYRRAQRLFES